MIVERKEDALLPRRGDRQRVSLSLKDVKGILHPLRHASLLCPSVRVTLRGLVRTPFGCTLRKTPADIGLSSSRSRPIWLQPYSPVDPSGLSPRYSRSRRGSASRRSLTRQTAAVCCESQGETPESPARLRVHFHVQKRHTHSRLLKRYPDRSFDVPVRSNVRVWRPMANKVGFSWSEPRLVFEQTSSGTRRVMRGDGTTSIEWVANLAQAGDGGGDTPPGAELGF